MSATSTATVVKSTIKWSIVLSVFLIAAGIAAIAVPLAAAIATSVLLGWLLIFSGAAHLVMAWHGHGRSLVWEVLLGLLYAVTGAYILMNPVLGLITLALAIAAYLLAEGVLEIILSFRLRPLPGSSWMLLDGVVTLILAVLIWRAWPSGADFVIGTLVGISMLFSGISRLMFSLAAQKLTSRLA